MLPRLININLMGGHGFNKRASCVYLDLWGAHGHRLRVETGVKPVGPNEAKGSFWTCSSGEQPDVETVHLFERGL